MLRSPVPKKTGISEGLIFSFCLSLIKRYKNNIMAEKRVLIHTHSIELKPMPDNIFTKIEMIPQRQPAKIMQIIFFISFPFKNT